MTTRLALFDIDGVLADDRHRIHFALDKKWTDYFEHDRMASDGLWPQGLRYVYLMQSLGYEIWYLTGRREDTRNVTATWLAAHGLPEGFLNMKRVGEFRKLGKYKADFIAELRASGKFSDIVLFDDDPKVIDAVREAHGEKFVRHCTWYIKQWPVIEAGKA